MRWDFANWQFRPVCGRFGLVSNWTTVSSSRRVGFGSFECKFAFVSVSSGFLCVSSARLSSSEGPRKRSSLAWVLKCPRKSPFAGVSRVCLSRCNWCDLCFHIANSVFSGSSFYLRPKAHFWIWRVLADAVGLAPFGACADCETCPK